MKPQEYTKICSQLDLPPTILSLMGIESSHPMIGHDLSQISPDFAGRAMMQYGDSHAYIYGNEAIIHAPQKEARQFLYKNKELIEAELDEDLAEIAKAHALWPMFAYREKKYLSINNQ